VKSVRTRNAWPTGKSARRHDVAPRASDRRASCSFNGPPARAPLLVGGLLLAECLRRAGSQLLRPGSRLRSTR
jgi:hypothetical protein